MNTGFAKVENRGGQCRVDVSLRNVCDAGEDGLRVYMFVREEQNLLGIFLGKIRCENGIGVFSCVTDEDDIEGSGYGLEQISGMIIKSDGKNIYGTGWDDRSVKVSHFRELNKEMSESDAPDGMTLIEEKKEESVNEVSESLEEKQFHGLEKVFEEGLRMYPFEDDQVSDCVRMEPQELGQLPMKYWYIMNNSFLLHGYYSYRHLIFARFTDGQLILGVPGVNYERERLMAERFGFNHFKSVQKKESKGVSFGYWYMDLEV